MLFYFKQREEKIIWNCSRVTPQTMKQYSRGDGIFPLLFSYKMISSLTMGCVKELQPVYSDVSFIHVTEYRVFQKLT